MFGFCISAGNRRLRRHDTGHRLTDGYRDSMLRKASESTCSPPEFPIQLVEAEGDGTWIPATWELRRSKSDLNQERLSERVTRLCSCLIHAVTGCLTSIMLRWMGTWAVRAAWFFFPLSLSIQGFVKRSIKKRDPHSRPSFP